MKKLIGEKQLARSLRRISHEILEKHNNLNDIVFFGILTRGYPLAKRLAKNIQDFESINLPVYKIDISNYRDDDKQKSMTKYTDCKEDISGKKVILVDDVIQTGRTAAAALFGIRDLGRPSQIELVILVDRGHRELPIKADYIGKNIPSSREEEVKVKLVEVDGVDSVSIE